MSASGPGRRHNGRLPFDAACVLKRLDPSSLSLARFDERARRAWFLTSRSRHSGDGGNARRDDWSWELYASELGILPARLEVAKQLLERVTAAVEERGLPWKPEFRKGFICMQRTGGYNAVVIDVWWGKVPRLAVKLPKSPTELGLTTPYPSLQEDWNSSELEWGGTVPSVDDIPDVMMALDAARSFHPLSGPMVVP